MFLPPPPGKFGPPLEKSADAHGCRKYFKLRTLENSSTIIITEAEVLN